MNVKTIQADLEVREFGSPGRQSLFIVCVDGLSLRAVNCPKIKLFQVGLKT